VLRVAFTSEFERGRLSDLVSLLSGRNYMVRIFTQHALKKLHLNRASEAPAREDSLLTPREEIHSFPCHRLCHHSEKPKARCSLSATSFLAGIIVWKPVFVRTRFANATMQGEFDFDTEAAGEGYSRWLAGRKLAAVELARRLNLPLNREVEVWLVGGIRLRGKLQLQEEMLFIEEDRVRHLELQVDHVSFTIREMESCVRLD